MNAFEEKTKEKTVKRKKNYYLVKSDVLGYAKRKGLINGRSKRQISERAHKDIYYISEEDEKKMLNECRRMRGNDQLELLKWCQNANNDLSGILFFSLITGIGYDYISKRYWIPIARKDFQGYRRKSLG